VSDTHPEAERILIESLRAAGPQGRGRILSDLINDALWRSHRAIARANPGVNEQERGLLFIEFHYGRELADRVRRFLKERESGHAAA
jgi:hypothetical protein